MILNPKTMKRYLRISFLLILFIIRSLPVVGETSSIYNDNIDKVHILRTKRFTVPGKPLQTPSKTYQECIAPGSKVGHCRHVASCGDDIFRSNFQRLTDYMCIIEGQFIGVCCPDDAPERSENVALPAGGLAGSLPAIAIEADDSVTFDSDRNGKPRISRIHRGCGTTEIESSRVTGGEATDSREWPWVAAILRQNLNKTWEQFCGGVLITDRHILTAGHCVHLLRPRELRIRLGEYDLRFPYETRALEFKVTEIRMHKGYIAITYTHDIAILKFTPPTIFNTYIWPVCLPPVGAVFERKNATVIGWGTVFYGGSSSSVLMEVDVPVWSQRDCVSSFTQEITPNQLCAGAYDGSGDACQGDSGGPLLHRLGNRRWVTIGIVSWGIGCGTPRKPGIYTRVNAYLDWIFANTIF